MWKIIIMSVYSLSMSSWQIHPLLLLLALLLGKCALKPWMYSKNWIPTWQYGGHLCQVWPPFSLMEAETKQQLEQQARNERWCWTQDQLSCFLEIIIKHVEMLRWSLGLKFNIWEWASHILKFETIFLLTGFFPFRFVVEKSEELNQRVFMMTPDTQAGSVW